MSTYRERAAAEIRNERPSETVTPIMRKLVTDSAALLGRGPADARARATAARRQAVEDLDALHAQVRTQFARRGIGYHLAETPADAVRLVRDLLGDARRVAKSKSMVGEEVGLTHALRAAGIDVLETDIGEYIVDIEGRGPSHITAPALHLNRARIRELLARTGAELPDDDPARLSRFVRDVVGAFFEDCDAAITGANQVIASSGRLVVVENEGNVSLGVSHPRRHIVITGYEKVIADEAGALAVLEVLAANATAQPLTSFTHFLAEPLPGQERHVVFVDHGRREIARDPRFREVLQCIRCGACMNACPVYRAAGGLSYGSAYMGPIGAVISPLLWPGKQYADLPLASSLCGRCTEVCPVGIPLHRMLLDLRAEGVAKGQTAGRAERLAWRAWALTFSGATRARAASALGRVGLRGIGRALRPRGHADDPRLLPELDLTRDPANLIANERRDESPVVPLGLQARTAIVGVDEVGLDDPAALFAERARALGVEVTQAYEARPGDRLVTAIAAIANTGSVVLAGDDAARRPLLRSQRIVARVEGDTLVRHPHDLAGRLGDGDALILTGASRTADIEKQIVRGIHGPEELLVVLGPPLT